MSIYFEQAQPAALLEAYPIGVAFLEGPAALNAGQLRELQEKRFARVIERAWQVPFYQRHWREAGLNPGYIKTLNDLDKVPVFSKNLIYCRRVEVTEFDIFLYRIFRTNISKTIKIYSWRRRFYLRGEGGSAEEIETIFETQDSEFQRFERI